MSLIHDRLQNEITDLKASKVAEVEKVRRESAERQHKLEAMVAMTQERLFEIEPVMTSLVAEYKELKAKCHNMPNIIKQEVQITTKKVCLKKYI